MHLSIRQSSSGISVGCLLLLVSIGCGGTDVVAIRDNQIDELRYQNARQRDALAEALRDVAGVRAHLESVESERSALSQRGQQLESSLRHANEQLRLVSAERDDARTKVTETEKSAERLQATLEKVRSVAGASATELTDLRMQKQEFETRLDALTKDQTSLTAQNSALTAELEQTKEELVRARAVVRSIRGEGSAEEVLLDSSPVALEKLRKENEGLQAKNSDLEKRLDFLLTGAVAAKPGDSPTNVPVGSIYRRHPVGIAKELGGIFQDRYERILRGEILWDSFDWTMIGVLAVFVLLVVWTTYRWVRLRRLVRQVHALKARVVELEQVPPTVAASGQEPDAPSRPAARPESGSTRVRRSPALRRSGFTAVLSSKDFLSQAESTPSALAEAEVAESPAPSPMAAVEAETVRDFGSAEDDDVRRMLDDELGEPEPVGVASGRPAAEAGARGAEPRRVIGARVWDEKGRDADDPARTQLIARVPDSSGPAVSLPEVEPRVAREIATPSLADESAETDGKETPDNGDLIAELKAVIHRKFDELMK